MELNFATEVAVVGGLRSVYTAIPFCDSRHIDAKRLTIACHSREIILGGVNKFND
jgi:hypothetical protein